MEPAPALGLRVVRGPDWEGGDEDGGEGFVGTVVGLEEGGGMVSVQWDMGQRNTYHCGRDNKFHLRILDSGPSGKCSKRFLSTQCAWCQEKDLVGCICRCTRCLDYYLCPQCYMTDRHSKRHPFFRVDSTDMKNRMRLKSRYDSRKTVVRGIFPHSHIVRGRDWKWQDQDGGAGTRGQVIAIKAWRNETLRSVAEVHWEGKKSNNIYRLGHKGKIDLLCVEPTEGGSYYLHHLPVLGVGVEGEGGMKLSSSERLAAGDTVKVELDEAVLKLLQADHGGWDDSMATVIGLPGVVNYIHSDGDPDIRFITNQIYRFNADVVSKVEGMVLYFIGDVVRVIDDMALVHHWQKEGPGWVDDLALTLGQVGVVRKLTHFSHVQVSVNGKRWLYSQHCLVRASPDLLPDNHGEQDIDMNARAEILALKAGMDKLDIIVLAASTGDVDRLRSVLRQHPEEVNRMVAGRTTVHEACKECYIEALRILLDYNPDLEMMDSNGLRPLHTCAFSNCGKAVKLLLEHGADVNSKDASENTALIVAATLGHNVALAVLLAHPLLNIHAGGQLGNTALQTATVARRSVTVDLLLEAGADPSIADYTGTSILHQAVGLGAHQLVEKMLMYYPNHINLQKETDGYSLLHMAASNIQHETMELILQQRGCDINITTTGTTILTPLHIAAHEGHTVQIELLVGHGANVNATTESGDTALHLILSRRNMKPPDATTPYTLEVQEKLETVFGGRNFAHYTVVASMLIMEGADFYQKNTSGVSPHARCTPDVADVLRQVVKECGRGTYHGSLRKSSIPLPKLEKKTVTVVTEDVKPLTSKELSKRDSNTVLNTGPVKLLSGDSENDQPAENRETVASKDTTTELAAEATAADSDDWLCCLCDQEVNVKLSPCGHSVMCSDCARIAKRCPICNDKIKGCTSESTCH